MESSNKYYIIRILVFLALLIGIISLLYGVFCWKDTSGAYYSVIDSLDAMEEDSIDVVFLGPSFTYSGFNPAILWDEAGITSFDLSIAGQDKTSSLYYLKDFLKKQSPKVVCVDISMATYDEYLMESTLYRNTLSMHPSINNVKLVNEIVEPEDRLSHILRWPVIHSRYDELTKYDFVEKKDSRYTLGYIYNFDTYIRTDSVPVIDTKNAGNISDVNKAWIDSLVKLSEEEGFKLLFYATSFLMSEEENQAVASTLKYIETVNMEYVNLSDSIDKTGLSYLTDYADNGHTNYYGAKKISDYFSKLLKSKYNLANHKGESSTKYLPYENASLYMKRVLRSEDLKRDELAVSELKDIASDDGYIVIIGLEGNYKEINKDAMGIFKEYNLTEEDWFNCGTWIINGGDVVDYLYAGGDASAYIKINDSEYLKIERETTGVWFDQTMVYSENKIINSYEQAYSGMYMLVYDAVLEKVVYNGYIE